MKKYLIATIALLLMNGCSGEKEEAASESTSANKTQIFKAQTDTLEKAKNVENMLQEKDELRQQQLAEDE